MRTKRHRRECDRASEVDPRSTPPDHREVEWLRSPRLVREDRTGSVRKPRHPGEAEGSSVDGRERVARQVKEGRNVATHGEDVSVIGGDLEP